MVAAKDTAACRSETGQEAAMSAAQQEVAAKQREMAAKQQEIDARVSGVATEIGELKAMMTQLLEQGRS